MSDAPLHGARIVVTRAPHQARDLRERLQELGAIVTELPLLEITPVVGEELAALDAAAGRLPTYRGLIFGSANAVHLFAARLSTPKAPLGLHLFAIGKATAAAVREVGLGEPHVAAAAVSESLLELVRGELGSGLAGARLLYPRAREGRDVAISGLRGAGAQVDVVVVYDTRPITRGPPLPECDFITFASPSAVRAFVARFGGTARAKIACIGPVTAEAAGEAGLEVAVVAEEFSAAGLAVALGAAWRP